MGDAAERSAREHIALSSNSARDKLATQSHLISYKVNRKGDSLRNGTKGNGSVKQILCCLQRHFPHMKSKLELSKRLNYKPEIPTSIGHF